MSSELEKKLLYNNLKVLEKEYNIGYNDLKLNKEESKYALEKKNNKYNIKFQDRYIHSTYNPEREAKAFIGGLEIVDQDAIFIIGLGLGYYLDELVTRYPNKKKIIIEPSPEIFLHLLKVKDIRNYLKDDNIIFLVDQPSLNIRNLFSDYLKNNKINKVLYKEMLIYKTIYLDYIKEVYKDISKIILLLKANLGTNMMFSEIWIENILKNLRHTVQYSNIKCLKDQFKNIPIVIVSAGPSLEKNMELLRTIKNKSLIIAVGTAASILDSNNIEPHIVMGVDGSEAEYDIFKSLKNHNPVLIYDNEINFKIVEEYKGDKIWLTTNGNLCSHYFLKKWEYDYVSLVSGGSVANTALVLSDWLEASSILLIGQDLAYTDKKIYADGNNRDVNNLDGKDYIKTEDIYGNEILTEDSFLSYKNWFEDYAKHIMKCRNVYNCTEGGLNIVGIENMEFKDAIDKYLVKEYDINNLLRTSIKNGDTIDEQLVSDLFLEVEKDIENCIDISEQRIDILNKIIEKKNYNKKSFNKDIDKVIGLTEDIESIDFYNGFIRNSTIKHTDVIAQGTNKAVSNEKIIKKKRKLLVNGLLRQYVFINECINISKCAIEMNNEEMHN